MKPNIAHNIPKLYVLQFARWFLVSMPIIIPFYESNGMDMQLVMLLQAYYSIVMVALEIPSGYVGDVFGRKQSLLIGAILTFLGFSVYSISYSFGGFMGAATLLAIGSSFISGSDSALLYDTLVEMKQEKDYVRLEGKNYAISNFSEASAGILGGLLAIYSLRYPFFVQAATASVGIWAAYALVEPKRYKLSRKESWQNMKKVLHFAMVENKHLRWFILLSSVLGCATLVIAWFAQAYFKFAEIPLIYYGILWTALNLTVGLAAWFAHRLQARFTAQQLIRLIMVLTFAGYFGIGFLGVVLGIVGIFLVYIGRGIATPVLKDLVNINTPSEMRATVLSVRSFFIRFFFASFSPVLGYITDVFSIQQAMALALLIFGIGALSSYGMLVGLSKGKG